MFREFRGDLYTPAAAKERRRADTRMTTPTRFMAAMSSTIFNAKTNTLSTLMIGNTDKTTYNTVINNPDHDASCSHSGGRGETPRRPNNGMANITTYVSA